MSQKYCKSKRILQLRRQHVLQGTKYCKTHWIPYPRHPKYGTSYAIPKSAIIRDPNIWGRRLHHRFFGVRLGITIVKQTLHSTAERSTSMSPLCSAEFKVMEILTPRARNPMCEGRILGRTKPSIAWEAYQ